jgi:hypothetical protein
VTVAALWLVGFGCLTAVADAAVIASGGVTFPGTVTVGDTGLPATVTMTNNNTPPQHGDVNTVCNAGDASPCGGTGIVLVPSCGNFGGACGIADPGVFQISPTGTGKPLTACAGTVFNIAVVDPALGTVRFTPQPAPATHVTLSGTTAACEIGFTFSVVKSPGTDAKPATPGNQTANVFEHQQTTSGLGVSTNTVTETTVDRNQPAQIVTAASPNAGVGGPLIDQAGVTGMVSATAGGTIFFSLYGPDDATCAGPPAFTNIQPATPAGTVATATSDPFVPTVAGTYRWVAEYSGDANNLPINGLCNAANESVTVTQDPPPLPPPPAPPPQPPPPPPIPDVAVFTGSSKSLRVSKTGKFTYGFLATPGRAGKAKLTSTKKIKVGSKKKKVSTAAKSFTVPANGKVKVNFTLSAKNLKALKKRTSLKCEVSVTVGAKTFSATLKLKPPKKKKKS